MIVELRHIGKTFPGVRALHDVSLSIDRAEVLGLVGENGAGKSTLIKILGGVYAAGTFTGEVVVDKTPRAFRSTTDARAAGIAVVHQELALVPHMTVAENLLLGREPTRFGMVDIVRLQAMARDILVNVLGPDHGIDLAAPIEHLGIGVRQTIEIARALADNARVVVLDEPTAALSDAETARLFALVRARRAKGTSFIYISHRLAEIAALCDRVAVMRDGELVDVLAGNAPTDEIVRHMTGKELGDVHARRARRSHVGVGSVTEPQSHGAEIDRVVMAEVLGGSSDRDVAAPGASHVGDSSAGLVTEPQSHGAEIDRGSEARPRSAPKVSGDVHARHRSHVGVGPAALVTEPQSHGAEIDRGSEARPRRARAGAFHVGLGRLPADPDVTPARDGRTPVLDVTGLAVAHPALPDRRVVDGLRLHVHAGEVVALAGAMGAGRTATLSALFGVARSRVTGRIRVDGREVRIANPIDAIRAGLALVPEDRKGAGLVLDLSVQDNLSMSAIAAKQLSRCGLVDAARAEQAALSRFRDLSIKAPGLGAEVATLSGGNQQKVVLGKWLELAPRVLLLDEPTRGVDVGAKVEIYRLVEELVGRGHAVLLASSDLPEIVRLADRVIVLREGQRAGELEGDAITQLAIMQLAMGVAPRVEPAVVIPAPPSIDYQRRHVVEGVMS